MLKFCRPKVVATLLARDEEDIIARNISHHISEGIETFVFTDNASQDKTKDVVSQFPQVKVIIDEPELNHNQRKWVTRMAKIACDFDPDWIVHLDADEFWCGFGRLPDAQESILKVSEIHQHLPGNLEYFVDGQKIVELGLPNTMPKVIHRPNPDIEIMNGNHNIVGGGAVRFIDEVSIHHYPIRSYDTLRKKAREGAEAILSQTGEAKSKAGIHWRKWNQLYREGKLEDFYNRMVSISKSWVQKGEIEKWTPATW
jgi:hypothetical protein